ncbi:protein DDI1 2-like isoform X3 [Leptotrombidium deliense]|uniref:Protein DDI1 2-like isoform X3 n=1 Tax=Leptotrombidium deliense TaxID=299467 RepID=A0A443SBV0_9ACAR|nr:protein DDI1 2-like isoform X3 [Leptotrombidium deliense]
MKLTIATLDEHIVTLEVSEDMELENFKALCAIELGMDSNKLSVLFDGKRLLDDKKSLKSLGLKEGDVVLVQQTNEIRNSAQPMFDFSHIRVPTNSGGPNMDDPEYIRNMLLSNPEQLSLLRQNNPPLAAALDAGSAQFERVLKEQQKMREERERQKLRMLQADPFDSEAQRLIDEEIKRKNIDSNMEAAMEYHPESYGQVTMLYINCKVNGYPVKAFIDSGAQSTIMSSDCAERCHITRLIDNRWAGIAKGVGVQKITGRIHLCQLQIENDYLPSSFTILQNQEMDMMLGLDMLKRHQCCIDLNRNVLKIGTTGTETTFLNESEIPSHLRNIASKSNPNEDTDLADAINRSVIEHQQKSNSPYQEADIQELVKKGFQREAVVEELKRAKGDKNQALIALLAKSLQMPPK